MTAAKKRIKAIITDVSDKVRLYHNIKRTLNKKPKSSGVSLPIAESSVDKVASTIALFFSCSWMIRLSMLSSITNLIA